MNQEAGVDGGKERRRDGLDGATQCTVAVDVVLHAVVFDVLLRVVMTAQVCVHLQATGKSKSKCAGQAAEAAAAAAEGESRRTEDHVRGALRVNAHSMGSSDQNQVLAV